MRFTKKEKEFMRIALNEAKKTLKKGNFPVGAILVLDGKIIGKSGNVLNSSKDWISHAESSLIKKKSSLIKKKYLPLIRNHSHKFPKIELYTTLEPCLMCLGTAIINRISKIIYLCPDPHGGATKIKPANLSKWYKQKWPEIKEGAYRKESKDLLIEYIERQKEDYWKETLNLFKKIKD